MIRHPSRPPDIPHLLDVLEKRRVEYVLIGSGGAAAHGIDVTAGDLDMVPNPARSNLDRLVEVLFDVEATPVGPFGVWTQFEAGDWKWSPRPTSEQELAAWKPDAEDIDSLDHLFVTCYGNLDVVPKIAGTFESLRARAVVRTWQGRQCCVAHVDDLLARATVPRREKDRQRVMALRELQRRAGVVNS